ncbi:hypothetical protein ACFYOV_31830 [Streptomyces sp. NPDC005931]|uniref:hypothetical protein n=1 Tax=Streptomyces sp. NPDC005931 TaxID=3364737 RepID=UPI0036B86575
MSDDYAALITTIILASLLIGSVQSYSLLRRWADSHLGTTEDGMDARTRALESIRRGEAPRPEDLEAIALAAQPVRVLRKTLLPLISSGVWLAVSAALVWVQVKVLLWSGTHEPPTDPQLAKQAFYVASGAVVLLVAEGLLRVMAYGASRILQSIQSLEEATPEERSELLQAIRRYVRKLPDPEGEPSAE